MAIKWARVVLSNLSVGKFTLDESFDVGEDTGTPVIDEYDAKMPFKFTGTLASELQISLGADQLTPEKKGEFEQLRRWDFEFAGSDEPSVLALT